MRSLRSTSFSVLSLVTIALAFGAGCGSGDDATDVETDDGELRETANLSLHLKIAESKVVFTSKVEAFTIDDGTRSSLPCRDRAFNLHGEKTLYDEGWSPDRAQAFADERGNFQDYVFTSCRDESTEILGWFGKARDIEMSITDTLLWHDYDPARLPLLLRRTTLGRDQASYFSCGTAFEKTLVRETENAKLFDIKMTCKSRTAPAKAVLGPIDFVTKPGAFAAVASYRDWMLPAVPANAASFEKVERALLGKVGEGTYSGAMSTLSKLCTLKVDKNGEALDVDHTISSSDRTRHLSLKASDLLGFAEGDLYPDPNRITGEPAGKFAAAEFKDGKGGSFVVRFEESNADQKVVRINGSEAYCRRLKR